MLPIVARSLGESGFGRFEVLIAALGATAILFDAGFGMAAVRFIGEKSLQWRTVVGSASILQAVAVVVATISFIPIMALAGPPDESLLALLGVTALFVLIEGYAVLASGIIRAELRGSLYLALSVVRLFLTIGFVALGVTLWGVVGAAAGLALGGLGFACFAWVQWAKAASIGDRETRATVIRYGVPLSTTTLAQWVIASSDRIFLKFQVSPATLGSYGANYRLGSVVLIFLATPLAVVWVREVQRISAQERERLIRQWRAYFTAAAGAATVFLTAASSVLIPAIFGADFEARPEIVFLICVSGWLGGLYYFVATPFLVAHSTLPLILVSGIVVAIGLTLNAVMIPLLGVEGAALATVASYAALCLVTAIVARTSKPVSNPELSTPEPPPVI